ncbi:hypothetical protein [Aquibacillus albus]|uniref:Uncharacterized protein n=1 Tax=Aquibacillus albus TaxID=1168171 RepID=A0ABS2MXK0_9BACI|nr:hypothetical protein [Aquibacillus albus]MBM7570595.1 hypothetical protein [Aquibacillus albus]
MGNQINGYYDFYTVISNERKIGGVIEAEEIQLRSGESFQFPVFTNIDYSGSTFYTICFITDNCTKMIVHVDDIRSIKSPVHKRIQDIKNEYYREIKINEKVNYLKRLCQADQGAYTKPFVEEAKLVIDDIGYKNVENLNDVNIKLLTKSEDKVFKIA